MGTIANTGVVEVEANSNQADVPVNTGFSRLSAFLTGSNAVAVTGDVTLTTEQFQTHARHVLSGTPGAAFVLNVPATARAFQVWNDTDAAATVQVAGGGGLSVSVPVGDAYILDCDGADVRAVGGGGGGGASSLDGLSDVDTTTAAPSNGDVLQFNGAEWTPGTVSGSQTTYLVPPNNYEIEAGTFTDAGLSVDFESGIGGFTAVLGTSGTIDLLAGAGPVYDTSTLPGALLVQPSKTTDINLRVDSILANDEQITIAITPSVNDDPTNNVQQIGIAFNDDDSAHGAGNYLQFYYDGTDNGDIKVFTGGVVGETHEGGFTGKRLYLRVIRQSDTLYFLFSADGRVWSILGSQAVGTFNNTWLFGSSTLNSGVAQPVSAFHWVRHNAYTGAYQPFGAPVGLNVSAVGTDYTVPFKGARVGRTVSQALTANTWGLVDWDTESVDTDAFHDTGTNPERLTIPSGVTKVRVAVYCRVINLALSSAWAVGRLRKNGVELAREGEGTYNGDDAVELHVSTGVIPVVAGDYFDFEVYPNEAADVSDQSFAVVEVVETDAAGVNAQTGTAYTLAGTDNGGVVTCDNASAITVTLPGDLPLGFAVTVFQTGAGGVTFSAGTGATLNNRSSHTGTAGQYARVTLTVVANSDGSSAVYVLAGDTV